MSDLFEDDPRDTPPARGTSGRTRALVITGAVLVVLFFGLTTFAGVYTDKLWYDVVGYTSVFTTLFWTRTVLFLVFGLVMAALIAVNTVVAYRTRPFLHFALSGPDQSGLDRYRDAVTPIRTWLVVGVALIAGVFAGTSASGRWRTYMLWRNGGEFGQEDAHFGRDVGFFVFELPWLHFLVDFVMTATVVALLVAAIVHYLYGGIRLQGGGDRLTGAAQVQLSVLLGVFVLAKAADYWLDRYDLVHGTSALMTGIGYTDDHAVLPAKSILTGIALICAVLFLVNIWRRTWLLPSVGLALLMISAILLGLIWPAIVQGVQVRPSPAEKEGPYLERHIAATREAYAIDEDHVEVQNYTVPARAEAADAAALDAQTASVPLVDPKLVHQLFEESQQARAYYAVADVLDVDRYVVGGQERALVMGVRELDQSGINASDQNWTNLHTVYTHGNGVIAAYANHRGLDNATESQDIQWAEGIQANEDDLVTEGPGEFEDRVYFGENSPEYSVVGRPEGADPVELDLPDRGAAAEGEGSDERTEYDGEGGVSVGSTFRQLLFAIKFGSMNFLLSERVTEASEVLYDRTPRERVEKVAPWLTLDDDAYPVIVEGRIKWVLDGYTTTDRYPSSKRESFETMTDDSLQQQTALRTLPTDEINYIRNAVKATVDAYDGTVTLYEWDEEDPILQAWKSAFPDTVEPREEIPAELLAHLRYPEDMFKAQRYQLARYHVTDVGDFLQGSDRWDVPEDPASQGHKQPPYRTFMDPTATAGSAAAEAQTQEIWSLTSTFVPYQRNNLAAVMSVNSDATSPEYGTIRVLERPDEQTQGPGQVFNEFKTNAVIADAVADFSRSGSTPFYGNLLTIPTSDDGLMYIQPVYAQQTGATASYPVLAYVLVSYDGQVGFGRTLQTAIESALTAAPGDSGTDGGDSEPTEPAEPTPSPTGEPTAEPTGEPTAEPTGQPGGEGSSEQRVARLLSEAQALFDQADEAGQTGNFARREKLLQQAREKVAQAVQLMQ